MAYVILPLTTSTLGPFAVAIIPPTWNVLSDLGMLPPSFYLYMFKCHF